jgi:hypothetical protein
MVMRNNAVTTTISTAVVAVGLAFGMVAPAAQAATAIAACRVTTYYADAKMTTKVGTTSTCPGSSEQNGRPTTTVSQLEVFEGGNVRREPSLPAGSLPCEFQADCKPSVVEAPAPAKHR